MLEVSAGFLDLAVFFPALEKERKTWDCKKYKNTR
jgi:hypothetical protein